MNIRSITNENCCGCTACESVCPKLAIAMNADIQGFIYPKVNGEKCIDCGLCLKVCNAKNSYKSDVVDSYAVKNTCKEILKKSSSGGISDAIARNCINNSGSVYGVIYDEEYRVVTARLTNYSDLEKLYGSKYVQTDPQKTFISVHDDLLAEKKVVYFGTSCHIAGLLSYLDEKKCDRRNLTTVDLICHGTPSPSVFSDYIAWLRKNKNFQRFQFRTKAKPWGYGSRNFGCTITYKNMISVNTKTLVDTLKSRVFLKLFFSNNCLRPKCYDCEYTDKRPADITIADYWGCVDEEPEFFSEDGVSAVIAYTEKGRNLIESLPSVEYIHSALGKIQKKQGMMHESAQKADTYNEFWKMYISRGFMPVAKKYGGYSVKSRFKKFLLDILTRGKNQ